MDNCLQCHAMMAYEESDTFKVVEAWEKSFNKMKEEFVKVCNELKRVTSERDTLIKNISEIRLCRDCKNEYMPIENEPCKSCSSNGWKSWEWKGINEEYVI